MFRPMRRRAQQLPDEEALKVLAEAPDGVLALAGDNGYPYAVPLNFACTPNGSAAYFHCALEGHKMDALSRSDKASFAVVTARDVMPEKLTTCFRSVIAFGRVSIVNDEGERERALRLLAEKFAPDLADTRVEEELASAGPRCAVLRMDFEHVTGKEAIELARSRRS